ncbi:E3 ubiquitin-protein ligase RAD18-like isoform X2 [Diprion similis]|uniref:E3 ubiquitin-protein ligase RAD18-like isoform X2 n=1 Tax=Diprion similis TaxID=362088 RepID=UPI001EF8E22D|nr:E3 ubiquitin-protein ligase RAD18-like isoform X2 [Diprion similis]
MGQSPDVAWPSEYIELTIDELLHCRICYEYIETSVVTPCSHNYCSICIRKFLHYKTQCPVCFENVYEKDLHPNRILDEFMECYSSLKVKLISCIDGVKININQTHPPSLPCGKPVATNKPVETPKKLFSIRVRDEAQLMETPKKNIATSTSENTPKISSLFVPKSADKSKAETSAERVLCPICSIDILATKINRHLDDCLKRQGSMSPPRQSRQNTLEPMPKYVMNILKDTQLRKLLKEYGLSTSGVRKVLEKRLQKFSTLYNAERDKIVPKSLPEIVRQCEEEEDAEKSVQRMNSSGSLLNIDRKSDPSSIEEAQKQYLNKNKDDYQKLIQSINRREKSQKKKGRSLFSRQLDEESMATTSSTPLTTTSQSLFSESNEKYEPNSSSIDLSQYLRSDSDSNISYPLQHYSRDDPMRFLALEVSSDSQNSPVKVESSLLPERKLQTPVDPDWKRHSASENSCAIVSSNPSWISGSPVFQSSRNENNLIPTTIIKEGGGSKSDIFDASTEDNLSDNCNDEHRSAMIRSKKFIRKSHKQWKRTKTGIGGQSETDSETDVETTRQRSSAKIQKGVSPETDNGSFDSDITKTRDVILDVGEPSYDGGNLSSSKMDKENSEKTEVEVVRRSSRKRSQISYATVSKVPKILEKKGKRKKVLDEQRSNVVDDVSDTLDVPIPTSADSKTENTVDQLAIAPKRSLRKRTNR